MTIPRYSYVYLRSVKISDTVRLKSSRHTIGTVIEVMDHSFIVYWKNKKKSMHSKLSKDIEIVDLAIELLIKKVK